jgi:hypothetical protein
MLFVAWRKNCSSIAIEVTSDDTGRQNYVKKSSAMQRVQPRHVCVSTNAPR